MKCSCFRLPRQGSRGSQLEKKQSNLEKVNGGNDNPKIGPSDRLKEVFERVHNRVPTERPPGDLVIRFLEELKI